jgi:hypothetical protein
MLLEVRNDAHTGYPSFPPAEVTWDAVSHLSAPLTDSTPDQNLDVVDGWGHPIWWVSSRQHYVIWSNGSDGNRDDTWQGAGVPFNPDCDVVVVDGHFVHWVEGIAYDVEGGQLEDLVQVATGLTTRPSHE